MSVPLPQPLAYPFAAPPAPGQAIELAPGLRWIRMPLPFALLTSLVVIQTFAASGGGFTVDARIVGLAAAVIALLLRAPFIVVVIIGAAVAAVPTRHSKGNTLCPAASSTSAKPSRTPAAGN